MKPKSERTYELLKRELIKHIGTSKEDDTRRFLKNEPLGDRKPTQFLRHLRVLAGTEFPEEILQTLWMRHLPTHMQALLVAHKDLTLALIQLRRTKTPKYHDTAKRSFD